MKTLLVNIKMALKLDPETAGVPDLNRALSEFLVRKFGYESTPGFLPSDGPSWAEKDWTLARNLSGPALAERLRNPLWGWNAGIDEEFQASIRALKATRRNDPDGLLANAARVQAAAATLANRPMAGSTHMILTGYPRTDNVMSIMNDVLFGQICTLPQDWAILAIK